MYRPLSRKLSSSFGFEGFPPVLPAVRKLAPSFSGEAVMPNGSFTTISNSYFSGKYGVLFWYPLDWTFVCPTEIVAFSDRASDFQKIGAEVIGISVDRWVSSSLL